VRIGAALIDLALLFGLLVVLSVTIGEASMGDGFSFSLNNNVDAALYLGLVLVYYFALEATIGQTVGKLLTGVRVVRADGETDRLLGRWRYAPRFGWWTGCRCCTWSVSSRCWPPASGSNGSVT
jgi:uncharacterized RDD family membrane protein YckC